MNCARCDNDIGNGKACSYCAAIVSTPGHRFVASAPTRTHWEKVTCREADCPDYLAGFTVALADGAKVGRFSDMVEWMRLQKRDGVMGFTEERVGDLILFKFPPGHECMEGLRGTHKQPIGADSIAPELVHVSSMGIYRHDNASDFREDMNQTHLQIARGGK